MPQLGCDVKELIEANLLKLKLGTLFFGNCPVHSINLALGPRAILAVNNSTEVLCKL